MVHPNVTALQPAPPNPFADDGQPRFGTYRGSFGDVDLSARAGSFLARRLRSIYGRKRWVYGAVATREVFAGFAIVDLDYASNGFAFAVHLETGELLADASFLGVPRLSASIDGRFGDGAKASFRAPGCSMQVSRAAGTAPYLVEVSAGRLRLEAVLDTAGAPPPLAVVLPLAQGDLDVTQKEALLPAAGSLKVGDRRFTLGGGYGGFDFTSGLFGRHTAWRWAYGIGEAVGGTRLAFNLSDGLGAPGASENAVWVGDELLPVGAPNFTFDPARPDGPWQVRTDDGALDLAFTARGLHLEKRNLVLVRSHFAQVAGTFAGDVRLPDGRSFRLDGLPGVTEDQRVVW
jgi:hypothetical protein